MVRTTVTLALLLGLVLSGRVASAQTQQPWLSDRRFGEGAGILSGGLEVHPGLAAELGYDSNYFQGSGEAADAFVAEPVVDIARLRITPSLSLRTLGEERRAQDADEAASPKANFALGAALRIDRLIPLGDAAVADQTQFGGDLGAEVEVGPGEPVGALIGASFSRIAQPVSDPAASGVGLDRNRYGGHLDFVWRPGGGVLSWSAGYGGNISRFDNTELELDRAEHGFRTRGRYRFLPRTALLYEGELGVITQLHRNSRLGNASPISSQLGINGLVTPRLAVLALAGIKAMFYEPTSSGALDDFDGVIGRAELTWFLGTAPEGLEGPEDRGLSHLRLGVQRDVFPGGIGNFYQLNRAFVALTMASGGVFVLTARGGHALVVHSTPRDDAGQPRSQEGQVIEQRPEAGLYAEYRVLPTVAILGNLEFTASLPNNYIVVDADRAEYLQDNLKFTRFTAMFGARWFL
jgi:hypothetical protein